MELFTIDNIFTLFILIFLQAVLGFDNLLYISIESRKVPPAKQAFVRRLGIAIALVLRILLLFLILKLITLFQNPFIAMHWDGILEFDLNLHSLIVLLGGVFIVYTGVKEITHMLTASPRKELEQIKQSSMFKSLMMIVLMNLVFSFDSILSAIALTDLFIIMAIAIVISAVLMVVLADRVADFLEKNKMYEVLGLFILLIVGIMLLSEGGHLAHLQIIGFPITPMSKGAFYFAIIVLVLVEVIQSKYKKNMLKNA